MEITPDVVKARFDPWKFNFYYVLSLQTHCKALLIRCNQRGRIRSTYIVMPICILAQDVMHDPNLKLEGLSVQKFKFQINFTPKLSSVPNLYLQTKMKFRNSCEHLGPPIASSISCTPGTSMLVQFITENLV